MYIIKAEANQIEKIVAMSVRAFETDVNPGSAVDFNHFLKLDKTSNNWVI